VAIRLRQDYEEGSRVVGRIYGAAEPEKRPAAPRAINIDTVIAVHRPRVFMYRHRVFTIARVPWLEGIVLEYAVDRVRALLAENVTENALREMEQLIGDAQEIIWRLCRKRWWQRRNPFTTMQLGEWFAVLSFYFECRMLLPDLALGTSQGSHTSYKSVLHTILPTAWRSSRKILDVGLTEKRESRVASTISNWDFVGRRSPQAG
jgi:hypothetical protein